MSEHGRRRTVLGDDLLAPTSSSAPSTSSSTSKRQRAASGPAAAGLGLFAAAGRSAAAAAAAARSAAAAAAAAAAEPKVQVKELESAIEALQQAKHDQARADASRAEALKKIQKALPAAEEMLRGAAETLLSAHEEAVPPPKSLRAEQADAQARSKALAVEVHRATGALAEHAYGAPSLPAVQGALTSGKKFLAAVKQVSGHVEQLHAQHAANSGGHNDSRPLAIRVLGIDQVRSVVLGSLSLRNLFAMRRACRDFWRWSVFEVATLPPLVLPCLGELNTFTFARGRPEYRTSTRIQIPETDFPGCDGRKFDACRSAIAHGPGNSSIYLAGGGGDDDPGSMLRSVSVWRPGNAGEIGGEWCALPPLPTRVTNASSCVVTVADGEEVLAVVGRIHKPVTEGDDASDANTPTALEVMVLREGTWQTLSSVPAAPRRQMSWCDYRAVALPNGRLAVVGADSRHREIHVLDIEADTWSTLPDLPVPHTHPLVVMRGQTMFVLGGLTPGAWDFERGVPTFSCEKHTLEDDGDGDWDDCATMPIWTRQPLVTDLTESRAYLVRDSLLVACLNVSGDVSLRLYDFDTNHWHSRDIEADFMSI